jgi:hypothetical protein
MVFDCKFFSSNFYHKKPATGSGSGSRASLNPDPVYHKLNLVRNFFLKIEVKTFHQCCGSGMFLGLPDPDPLVQDPDPDSFIIKQKQ